MSLRSRILPQTQFATSPLSRFLRGVPSNVGIKSLVFAITTRFLRPDGLFRPDDLSNSFFLQPVTITLFILGERDLRVAPGVEVADLMDALDGACRRAPFFGVVFAVHVGVGVFEQRDARRASLLRAPTDDARLVDVKITGTGTATPFVFAAIDQIVLKPIPAGV